MTGFVKLSVVQAQKESCVHSEVGSAISVYRRLHTIKPSFLRVSRNWDYFHLFSYLNDSHFERTTFSFTSAQFHKYTTV